MLAEAFEALPRVYGRLGGFLAGSLARRVDDATPWPLRPLTHLLAAPVVALLEDTGVLARYEKQPDLWHGTVALYPVDSLYIVSDRTVPLDRSVSETAADVVYAAITDNTRRFMASLPDSPCENFLDLCSGSGIAALAAASRYARHSWSCDLVERCVTFAEFSRKAHAVRMLGRTFSFSADESIHTESSYKYSIARFQDLARRAGWTPDKVWTDERDMFSVHALRAGTT